MNEAKVIDGKALAKEIQEEVKEQIQKLGLTPGLGVVLIGNDPASELYVKLKQKQSQEVGINFCLYKLEQDAPKKEILETINWLNKDNEIDAILVQLPLPNHLDTDTVIRAINPKKDVDRFHPDNIKAYLNDTASIVPGLSMGIMQLIQSTGEDLANKQAVIIAKSPEFTSTLSHTLAAFDTTTKSVNPNDKDLRSKTCKTDILITAIGKPRIITKEYTKPGAIIIDVGTTYIGDKTNGDVDFESCKESASWITPVPGGVGPMTVAILLKNTVALAKEK